jgi:Tfp pilus assembly protein PilF
MICKLCPLFLFVVLPCWSPSCLAQASADQSPDLLSHQQKAQQYLHQKRPDLAIPEFEAAVAIDPGNAETQGNLGVLLFFRGSYAAAIPHFRAALAQQPALAKLQGLLGIAEAKTTDFEAARKDLQASFPSIPDRRFKVQVGLELVGLYTQAGDLEAALPTLAALRQTDPANAEVLYAAYRTYTDLSSESMLALALAAPDSAQMHQLLAHEQIKQGNTSAALAEYRRAIAIDPHLPGVHFEMAELLHTSSEEASKKEALQEYQAALSADPANEKAERRIAEIDAQKGNTAQAAEEFAQAIKLGPADAEANVGLAKLLNGSAQSGQAMELLQNALRIDPTNAIAHYRLALLYRQKGEIESSKQEMETYQKLKDEKAKLRATYKDLLIKPNEIRNDEKNDK